MGGSTEPNQELAATEILMQRPWLAHVAFIFLAMSSVVTACSARAQSFADFILSTDGGDGAVTQRTPLAGYDLAFEIRGNDAGGMNLFTRFQTSALDDVTVEFAWSYRTNDGPSYDPAGYTLNASDVLLTSPDGTSSQSGSGSFDATKGQVYGWYVESTDGC